jgi:hypothetical protein
MKTIILSCFAIVLFATLSLAAECPVGYEPVTAAFLAQADDVKRMELSASDKASTEEKSSVFRGKEEALHSEFRNKAAELTMMLSGDAPDRSKADVLAVRLVDIIKELNDLRVTYAFEMADLFKAGNLRKVSARLPRRDPRCDGSLAIPSMRRSLTGKEREIIGMTEDEMKYLKDFERREDYFRTEQEDMRSRLTRALRARDMDRTAIGLILEKLNASVHQQVTNRLDRFFYADQVLFSPERMAKLNTFDEKHKKRVTPPKRTK